MSEFELVYLWVEEYKNIKNQGFNFSPRFKCEYDEGTKELTIKENKDYVSIFPENINVTAIVGENGSGKSSIFEVLSFLYFQGLIFNEKDKTFFLFYKNDKFYIQCENYKSLPLNKEDLKRILTVKNNTKIQVNKNLCARGDMPLIHFSNCITDITNNYKLKSLKSYSNFFNGIQPEKPLIESVNTYDNFNQKFQYILNQNVGFYSFIDEKLEFDNYKYEIYFAELESNIVQLDNIELKKLLSFQEMKTDDKKELLYQFFISVLYEIISHVLIENDRKIYGDQPSEVYINLISSSVEEDLIKILKSEENAKNKYQKFLKHCNNLLKVDEIEFNLNGVFNDTNIQFIFENFKIGNMKSDKSYTILKSNLFNISGTFKEIEVNLLLKKLLEYKILRINFHKLSNSEYNFLEMSSGEKLYVNLLTNFTYTLLKLNETYRGILLFDEIELSFHPKWHKRLLSDVLYIYNYVKNIKKLYLHLIFTSHSPFILSDIPKENVIFLKNGKQENIDIDTFGANIHTLLSHGFFINDGLMGEFAKERINKAITYLNQKTLSEKEIDYCENIILIIGEPILKRQLQKMLDSKRLSEIDYIKKQIEELQEELAKKEDKK